MQGYKLWYFLAVILLLLSSGFAWLDGWQYRKPITITEQSGTDLTDYQVLLTIDTASLISAGKLNSDCSDLRFADNADNLLSYWIEEGCNTASTKVWVRVPYIPAGKTTTFYMYYGNQEADSLSNKTTVFDYFTDFNTEQSSDFSVVTYPGGTVGAYVDETTIAYSGSRAMGLYLTGSGSGWQFAYYNNKIFTTAGYEITAYVQANDPDSSNINDIAGIIFGHNETDWVSILVWTKYDKIITMNANSTTVERVDYVYDLSPNTWYKLKIVVLYDGTVKFYGPDGTLLREDNINGQIFPAYFGIAGYWSDDLAIVDYVTIKKYTESEPVFNVGVEETYRNPIIVNILIPSENEAFKDTSIQATFTISSTIEIETCSYSLDNQANITLPNCENFTLTSLTEGIHNLTIWAWNSTEGVYSKDFVSFKVDLTPPTIIFLSPKNEETERTIFVNFITVDNITSVAGCGYKIDDENWGNLPGCTNFSYTFSEAGWHIIWINATDGVGHTAVESKSVLINPIQTIWLKDADSGGIIQEYTIYLWNVTNFTLVRGTATGNVSWKLFEGPLGPSKFQIFAEGYNKTVFTLNISLYTNINHTFYVEPASLILSCYDEQRLISIPCKLVISNNTKTETFSRAAWILYDDFSGNNYEFPDTSKWQVERCDGGESYCTRIENSKLRVKYTYTPAGGCDWSAVHSKSFSTMFEFDISGCYVVGSGYGGIYLMDKDGNKLYIYENCKNGHFKIYTRDKKAYIYVDGNYEGTIDLSSLHGAEYAIGFLSGECRDSSGATTKSTVFYVDNMNFIGKFFRSWEELPLGDVKIDVMPDNEEEFFMTDYVARSYYVHLDEYTAAELNAYLLQSSQALTQQIFVRSASGQPVENALIVLRRQINGSWVDIGEVKTDASGYAQIPLDPTTTYRFYVFSESGYAEGSLTPSPSIRTITLYPKENIEQTPILGVDYRIEIWNMSLGKTARVEFTVNSNMGDIEYFFLNISWNGENIFYRKISGSTSGGTIVAEFPVEHEAYTLIYGFKRANYGELAWIKPLFVGKIHEVVNGSIKGVLEKSEASPFAKVIAVVLGLIIGVAIHPLFALALLWFFGLGGWIPVWIPTLTTLLAVILLLGGVI